MKWIGQHIYDQISRFRDDVYLEDLSTTTETNVLVVDSDGKVSKSTTLADDIIESEIDTLAGLTSFGSAGATTNIAAGDLTMYDATGVEANPTISLGSSATNRFEIKSVYNLGGDVLCDVDFTTYTASSTANDGRYNWYVDEVLIALLNDNGLYVYGVGTVQAGDGATLTAKDTTTSSATEGGKLRLRSDDGAAMENDHRLGVIEFSGAEDSGNTIAIGARIQAIARDAWGGSSNDADLEFYTTDGTTESKVLTLDADKLATFTGAVTVTGALTGTLATVSQPNITGVGTIGTGVWEGTAIASAYLDADTAHLSSTKQVTYHNYRADQGTTKTYLGLADADSEGTSTTNVDIPFTAPFAGKLLKIFLKSNKNLSSHTLTWRLETQATGVTFSTGPTIVGTQSGAGCTNSSITNYDFTSSLDSGDNIIDAGDTLYLSLQSDTDFGSNVIYYITCLWEWNLS